MKTVTANEEEIKIENRNMIKCNEKTIAELVLFLKRHGFYLEDRVDNRPSENVICLYYGNKDISRKLEFSNGIITEATIVEAFKENNYELVDKQLFEKIEEFYSPSRIYNLGVNLQEMINDNIIKLNSNFTISDLYKTKITGDEYLNLGTNFQRDKILSYNDENFISLTMTEFKERIMGWIVETFKLESKQSLKKELPKYIKRQYVL